MTNLKSHKTKSHAEKSHELFYYNGKRRSLKSFIKNLWIRRYADRDFTVNDRNQIVQQAIEFYDISQSDLNKRITHPANFGKSENYVTLQTIIYDFIAYPHARDEESDEDEDDENVTYSARIKREQRFNSNVTSVSTSFGSDSDDDEDSDGLGEDLLYKLVPQIYADAYDSLQALKREKETINEEKTMMAYKQMLNELDAGVTAVVKDLANKYYGISDGDKIESAIRRARRLREREIIECHNCGQHFHKRRANQKYCDYYDGKNSCYERSRRVN